MSNALILILALAGGPAEPPVMVVPSPASQGMSHASYVSGSDRDARVSCLVERATGRQVCRSMASWRAIARRLERAQRARGN
ncbi:hypothetical protein E2493_20380 [Sphingomonas parva]|uniref:Uncharacterized protein n=1 Tax=Sphingomonas parva TaxID=2555898 RepID=A0A4Y8ZML3_9SPHN|nr:hypothetical protein [Sphingomonas parva]TFI56395.1 hypothetical protein E2493_20380 [Sphingomonas parva]